MFRRIKYYNLIIIFITRIDNNKIYNLKYLLFSILHIILQ